MKFCLSCLQKCHTIQNCPMLHFVPDKLFYLRRFASSITQQRSNLKIQRKKANFRTLKNLEKIQEAASQINNSIDNLSNSNESSSADESIEKSIVEKDRSSTRNMTDNSIKKPKRNSQITFNLVMLYFEKKKSIFFYLELLEKI